MSDINSRIIPLLALRGLIIFPGMQLHFDVGRKKSINAIQSAMGDDRIIFLVSQKDVRNDDPDFEDLYNIGCVARIKQIVTLHNDGIRVVVEGLSRGHAIEFFNRKDSFYANIETLADSRTKITKAKERAVLNKAKEAFDLYAAQNPKLAPDVVLEVMASEDCGKLADYIASNIAIELEDKQYLLEEINPYKRLEKLIVMLAFEQKVTMYEKEINDKVRAQIDQNQRDYFLREQIKVISEELGELENPQEEADAYKEKILSLNLDNETQNKLLKEASRLYKMPPGSHEATVVRGYLDTCIDLPWNKTTADKTDIKKAMQQLDRDHYGLQKVKERIVEVLAVRALTPGIKGQIICLIGPPGVGKTSIAKSIARCMGRKYVRISLGGVRDEADIRGHRRTYIGAMPGRIISAVLQAKTKNPLILMDEIDKLSSDFRGDPSAALLEALDAEQNSAFYDHYIEVPFDLSGAFFVLTANSEDTIPPALYDRMEVIHLGSYTSEEKLQIAKRHLVRKQMKRHGLTAKTCTITDSSINGIIDFYTRESGVRNLEREIAALCRKAAKTVIEGGIDKVTVTAGNLEKYLGVKKYRPEEHFNDEVGLVNGLAWTRVGGEIMQIEAAVMPGSGKLTLTGSLGDIMQESAKSALSCIRTRSDYLNVPPDFYKNLDVHINATEGAVPKDGPSAGITMTVALISSLSGVPVSGKTAMTGEITLRGRVLPIGGLKEKTMAAYRAGITKVIIPKDNLPDLSELDPLITQNIRFVPVENIDEVLSEVFVGDGYLKKPENITVADAGNIMGAIGSMGEKPTAIGSISN